MNFKKIKTVIFDFDGVFTNNKVIISEDGKESVICNRSDGIGIDMLRKLNIYMKIVSSEKNPVVKIRAEKLKLSVAYGVKSKIEEVNKFCDLNNVSIQETAFLGNDLNDIECMKKVGFPIAVADAIEEVKLISSYILSKKGGNGAVRELCELIYNSQVNG